MNPKIPTNEEIVSQVNAEEHFRKSQNHLDLAAKEVKRLRFNIKYNKAEIQKSSLHALRNQAMEVAALIENLEGL